jgi:hypothetical protein
VNILHLHRPVGGKAEATVAVGLGTDERSAANTTRGAVTASHEEGSQMKTAKIMTTVA